MYAIKDELNHFSVKVLKIMQISLSKGRIPSRTRKGFSWSGRIRIWIHKSDSNCVLGEACFNPQDDEDVEDSNLEAPLMKFQRGEDVPSDFEVPLQIPAARKLYN